MSLLAHTALLAQQAFGPLEGVGTALAGWAVDDPDRHRPKPPVVDGDTLRLFGDTRVYLVADHTQSEWSDHDYLHMLHDGREMSFTLDLSRVPCGCIATVYLVQMDRPGLTDANYCDANTSPSHWCTEIDITEGNVAGYQSALHTKQGHADGNVCDADGCYAKLGAAASGAAAGAYGGGATIDTAQPFDVVTSVDHLDGLRIVLRQSGREVVAFDNHRAGNPEGRGVPFGEVGNIEKSMRSGLTLVASLWSQPGGSQWLSGPSCWSGCDLTSATFTLSNLKVPSTSPRPPAPAPSPPPPPPSPSPPPPRSPPPCPSFWGPHCPGRPQPTTAAARRHHHRTRRRHHRRRFRTAAAIAAVAAAAAHRAAACKPRRPARGGGRGTLEVGAGMAMGLAVAALLLTARRHLRERSARRNADAVADAEGGARHPPRRTGRGERQEKELLVMPTAAAATDL